MVFRKKPPALGKGIEGFGPDQLASYQDELLRQRANVAGRVSNANTRAAVLIGVTGVFGGTALVTASGELWVEIVSLALYFVAAVCGLVALRSTMSSEVDLRAILKAEANQPPIHVARAVVMSNLVAHEDHIRIMTTNARWLRAGFAVLVLAWVASGAGSIWHFAQPSSTDKPSIVEIQGDVNVKQH